MNKQIAEEKLSQEKLSFSDIDQISKIFKTLSWRNQQVWVNHAVRNEKTRERLIVGALQSNNMLLAVALALRKPIVI